ncbi:MAG: hypothetical protein NVSMB30_19230 [Hymenobacter sp.]
MLVLALGLPQWGRAQAVALATYAVSTVTAATGDQLSPSSVGPHVSASALALHYNPAYFGVGSGTTTSANANGASFFGLYQFPTTGTYDPTTIATSTATSTQYLEFSLTPATGYKLNIPTVTVVVKGKSTGPDSFDFRASLDNFVTSNVSIGTVSGAKSNSGAILMGTLPAAFLQTTQTITFRFYGYNASNNGARDADKPGGIISDFTVSNAGPLPVELVDFAAQAVKNADAQLTWRTASEKNNDHFEVERSVDGVDFVKIGQVQGRGTAAAPTDYALTDAGVGAKASGTLYYRLKQVDANGASTYSPVRAVTFNQLSAPALGLFSNPATDAAQIDLTQLPSGSYRVRVLDGLGREVLGATMAAGLTHQLDLRALASGAYTVRVTAQAGGQSLTLAKRLLKE